MHALLVVLAVAAVLVAAGWRYRPAIVVFFVRLRLDRADRRHDLPQPLLVRDAWRRCWWCFLPADACCRSTPAGAVPRTVPRGAVWLVRAQVAVVYVFAGLAKLHADWLWRALPLRLWLPARSGLATSSAACSTSAGRRTSSLGGASFDCAVVPLLLWRRTRPFALAAVVAFHVATWGLFPIGVFPWLMIGGATAVLRARLAAPR